MTNTVGNPATTIQESSGWSQMTRRVDSLAGLNSELRFHVDSDTTVQFAGLAIDDVSVTGCRTLSADLSITKTDGVTTAVPGGSVTYTITGSNAGPDPVTGATIADTFPASETCTWTCLAQVAAPARRPDRATSMTRSTCRPVAASPIRPVVRFRQQRPEPW